MYRAPPHALVFPDQRDRTPYGVTMQYRPPMTNELTTVFETTLRSDSALPENVLRLAIGAVVLWLGIRRFPERKLSSVFLVLFAVVWLAAHTFFLWTYVATYRHLRSGQCEVTEGVVHVTHEQPYQGHSSGDRITVGGKSFVVDYFFVTPGYHQSIAHGGALKEGTFTRLHHRDGVILKVEVATGK